MFDRPLAFGPVKDVALTLGLDWNTKNNAFQSRKRMILIGPTLKFALPAGFLDLSLFYAREWNHCGLDSCRQPGNHSRMAFDPFYQLNLTWGIPFALGSLPMKFQGFYSYSGEKGDDYRRNPTADEQLMRTSLMLDAGAVLGGARNTVWIGPGYEYWRNKFGNRAVATDRRGRLVDQPGVAFLSAAFFFASPQSKYLDNRAGWQYAL
ncbi:hypothetical protein NWF32_22915 [Pseudomonas qingdaonensis]|nr:hypothetical protein [Pseudomonas qingdaonensis]